MRRSPSWPNWSDRSRSSAPDLPLDAADGVAQRSEQGGGRVVDVAGGLEVDHALAQHVALGLGAGATGRAGVERAESHGEQAADECADDEPDEQSGEVHASTVPDAADSARPRHPADGTRGRPASVADGIRPGRPRGGSVC